MAEIRVRPATAAEVERVLAFWKEAARGVSVSDDSQGVTRLIERDPEALLLAERDGELVGTVIAGFDGWRCHLYRLAVAPAWRRRGVATALVEAAELRFAAVGGRRVDAMVLEDNERARRVWAALGYGRQRDWARWVKPLPR
ncbi:GNAT family N-acetyltransferase [Streptomyces sp. URMC 129]|uniref:GNAT family N-acetyltransferase n=1 Tax=Streptomyces sp. URMC 129 TaxID=3423407 RepID=UPI003F1C686C